MLTNAQLRVLKYLEKSHQFVAPPQLKTLPKEERHTFNARTLRYLCMMGYIVYDGRFPGAVRAKYKITDAGRIALRGHGES